ncbi:MAG TPA: ABC transporter ATP-binding protein [Firmicutes bacterium]|nr:ABC transporter ATP-binding protein [Bacillota bacterium]
MEPIVRLRGITKEFPGVLANDRVDLEVFPGTIHALLGENGAGKTTLMNILYGLYQPDAGEIFIRGEKVRVTDPNVAIRHGIGMVHQHFMLIPPLTVAENIVLGNEPRRGLSLDLKRAVKVARELSDRFGLTVDPLARIEGISVGMQQRVEILKALYRGAEVLILDEPTAVLTPQEVRELKAILDALVAQGKAIIFITHKLKEIMAMAQVVTVIRRGRVVKTLPTAETTPQELASLMVGREVILQVAKGPAKPGEAALRLEGVTANNNRRLPALRGIDLEVRRGEILGIAGVDGNGQTELVEVLTGLRPVTGGRILLKGREITRVKTRHRLRQGLGHIPEDRQKRGLVLDFSVAENLILASYDRPPFASGLNLNQAAVRQNAERLVREFDIRTPSAETPARSLSGGNQQKVIVAREIDRDPDVLIAAQPTRGLDVGAIEFVHERLVGERDRGKAVLLVSFELDEILSLADRIAVMYEGRIVDVLPAGEATEEILGLLMSGAARSAQEARAAGGGNGRG